MITEEEISQVRSATDLVALIGTRTVLKQRRNEFWGCCPFHNEKTPSFKVDPVSQFYYCFGCGESGDAFTFTMKTENVDFPDAVRLLAQRANIELSEEAANPQRGRKARILALVAATTAFYHQQLMRVKSPKADAARAYLGSRGMSGDVAKLWALGFAPGGGQLVRQLQTQGYTAQEMLDADVARYASGSGGRLVDRFYDRVIFPIHDLQGRPIAFGGRVFLPDDESPAKYLNSAETVLFKKRDNLYAVDKAKAYIVNLGFTIVVEGYTDTIALHKAGFQNTVATLGTALTAEHLKLLARFAERVVLLFDGDEAGHRAADRALDLIGSALAPTATDSRRADVYVALLPGNHDPADYIEAEGAEALGAVLKDAVPLVRYGLDRTLERFAIYQPEQRSRAEAAVLQILLPLKNTALASDYISYLSDRFNLSEIAETEMRQRFERMTPVRRPANEVPSSSTGTAPVTDTQTGRTGAAADTTTAATGDGARFSSAYPAGSESMMSRDAAAAKITSLERELLFLFIEHPELRVQLAPALQSTIWVSEMHGQLAAALLEMNQSKIFSSASECLAVLTARLPVAAASLSAARLREYTSVDPVRLADLLLFSLRETKLEAAISRINGERRALSDDDPRKQQLFYELVPLQQELAELRKRFRA